MSSKRGPNGRGSIYQDKHGVWWAQLPKGEDGKRPKRSAKTEAEAVVKLAELEKERAAGIVLSENPTVKELIDGWLTLMIQPNASARTFEDWKYQSKRYISDHIGTIRVKKLAASRVQQLFKKLLDSGLSPGTVRAVRKMLIAALETAITWRIVTENVAKGKNTRVPKPTSTMRIWTDVQARRFLDAVESHRLGLLYVLALSLGLRQAELIGLTWSDVDYERRELHVRSQVRRHKKATLRKAPKMERPRTIPLDDTLIAALRAHWRNQQEERRITEGWVESGLIFPSERGTALFGSALWLHFKATTARVNLPPIRFHDTRHTAASLMLANGVSLADVAAILGHANPAITAKLYLHSFEDGRRAAVETMGRLLQRRAS